MPLSGTKINVLAVPKSMAMSFLKYLLENMGQIAVFISFYEFVNFTRFQFLPTPIVCAKPHETGVLTVFGNISFGNTPRDLALR
jgi:hypothetical protein